MTTNREHDIEAELRGLASWEQSTPGLWRAAIERSAHTRATKLSLFTRPTPQRVLGAIAAVLLITVTVGMMLPSLGRARVRASDLGPASQASDAPAPAEAARLDDFLVDVQAEDERGHGGVREAFDFPTAESIARQIIRRAFITIETTDVRAVFLKAQALPRFSLGEYAGASQIKDDDGVQRADLVLRIAAARLDDVLSDLRGLGTVLDENVTAEDVSRQVVDVEARLRNERRTEEELLGLLSARKDADLDDVLAVTRELAIVRERIERLVAERDRLGGLARLATVTVVIREPDASDVDRDTGLWSWFVVAMRDALDDGTRTLLATLAGIVRIAIGGLPWLLLLGWVGWWAWRRWRPLPEV